MMMLMKAVVIILTMKVLAMNGELMDQMMKTIHMNIHMKDLEVAMKNPHLHGSTGLQNLQNRPHQSHLNLQSDLQRQPWKLQQKKNNLVECLDVLEDQVPRKFLIMDI